jgi:DsbC/DsbD-like thiol-disulfide interchange protein
LPFALTQDRPDQPSLVAVRISLGICKDICIPAEILLQAQVTGQEAAHQAILAALADQPISAQAAGLAAVLCQIAPISDGLRLSAVIDLPRPDMADYHSVAVEYGAAEVWVSSPSTQRVGDSLRVVVDLVPPQAKPFDLNAQDVRLTLLGETRAIDVQGCQIVTPD